MVKILIGFILGVAVSTVGFSGIAKIGDRAVDQTKTIVQDVAK
jgi:hypothetical protein